MTKWHPIARRVVAAFFKRQLFALTVLVVCLPTPGVLGAEVVPPFVAAVERFAPHGDLPAQDAGRLLVTELSCTACHQTSEPQLAPKRGPLLNAVGSRLSADWIRRFLAQPEETKPGTTMPAIIAGLPPAEQPDAVNALTAFLTSLQQPFPELKASGALPVPAEFWAKGDADHGRKLFHQVGCVSCHEPEADYEVVQVKQSPLDELLETLEPDELAELGLTSAARRVASVPLPNTAEKYSAIALTYFLFDPIAVRPAARMPHLGLSAVEAADVAAYLRRRDRGARVESPDSGTVTDLSNRDELIAKGRSLFTSLGCANCHAVDGVAPRTDYPTYEKVQAATAAACRGV
ncbi:MAG: c-type cytochrome, partial [Planctomycetaceae bacterium]|nr:c-type cytochrome [Planctomycetaceae bacterium]